MRARELPDLLECVGAAGESILRRHRRWQVQVPSAAGVRRVMLILVNVSPREGDVNVR